MTRIHLLLAMITLVAPALTRPALANAAKRPNIVVILVDDMGFSDIGCYGGEIATPRIDRLAAGGLRFTQFYNTGRCCPTRASLLTGLYSHQTGVGHMTQDKRVPGYRGSLNDRCMTLAELLRRAGYFTAMTGKWHVGASAASMLPLQRGFDRFYGVPEGGGFYFRLKKGRTIRVGNDVLYSKDKQPPKGWYSTDAWTEHGIQFAKEAVAAKKPFFLYLAHNAPHFPLQAPADEIARWRGKFRDGWDALRAARLRRQIELGIVDKKQALSPRPAEVKAWTDTTEAEKDRFDETMAVYAAVMERLDRSVGQLVDALEKEGVLDNTLLLFLSDNGGTAEGGIYGRLGEGMPGSAESDVYYGMCWAILSNTPFRRFKRYVHEGGVATPLIVHWPEGLKGKGLRRQVGHVIDIVPTCLEVAGAKYPSEWNGKALLPLEGKSLVPAFDDRPLEREALYWEHEGNAAVRAGDWKLVRLGRGGAWELYDLKTDRAEQHDLAKKRPQLARDLQERWQAWAVRTNVIPYPAAGKKKAKSGKK